MSSLDQETEDCDESSILIPTLNKSTMGMAVRQEKVEDDTNG
jgi:hypothetical protein